MDEIENVILIIENAHQALHNTIGLVMDNYDVPNDYPGLYKILDSADEMATDIEYHISNVRYELNKHNEEAV